jgi:putative transposase
MLGYTSQRPFQDAELHATLKCLTQQHPRYGHRRIWALLRRQGEHVNHKRVYRCWRASGLNLHARRRRRRAGPPSPRPPEATKPHAIWAYDFVHDRCANGEALKCLAVGDAYTRMCLAIEVSHWIDSRQVVAFLERLIHTHGMPRSLRGDNGPARIRRQCDQSVALHPGNRHRVYRAGETLENGAIESFIGKLRDEYLTMEWFLNRQEARVIIESY